ncbi:hypothetical protein DNTS_032603 [Danionella cerebrum]|uniref:Transmembrane channel-like protein n=1 Tax=Danionella cerebrum TaxID=2873325 RepID=A0A553PYF5_9TELE|nr:hypothetical protein DNTS_032603 [Danionella translucida]TRY82676.1 hypothetical protein DNTS_032603 [Danionella translucida]
MDEDQEERSIHLQRLLSGESLVSDVSGESCEFYQTEIYSLLPSSKANRKPSPDGESLENDKWLHLDGASWSPGVPLRASPLCLKDKIEIRERQQLQRHSIGCWNAWRRTLHIMRRRLMDQAGMVISGLLPWRHTIHKIEGQFGAGVKAYFVFLRYLLALNLLYCVIITAATLTPRFLFGDAQSSRKHKLGFKDLFLGTGFLEESPLFHSFYSGGSTLDYPCLNPALLFLLGMISILLLSSFMIIRRTVVGYKHSWLIGKGSGSNLSFKVFCGWDFCIQSPRAALLKQTLIRNQIRMVLEEQAFHQKVQLRTLSQWVWLGFIRMLLNTAVVILLGGSFTLIYFAILHSKPRCEDQGMCLVLHYLPPVTMTLVNYLLPQIFSKISEFEGYSLTGQLNITLIRSIFLKLASLGIYLSFFISTQGSTAENTQNVCRENNFGKEMYKLTIFNLLESFLNTFCVAYPRTLLVERFPSSRLVQAVGQKQFQISFSVLDLVTSQTITWFTVLRCCAPAHRMFRTVSSTVLFHFILLLGLCMSAITVVANINRFIPGDCGPFEGNRTVFNVTGTCIETLPDPVQRGVRYISSEAFALTIILAQVVILTSYVSRGRENRKAIERLKDMLVICSSDKRFLVKQHSTMMRRQRRTLQHQCLS